MKRMFTKQFVCCLLLILYMVLLCQTAIAVMLTVTDGHICGSITVQKGNMSQESITETFLIDCPEPENAFRPEIITTSKGYVSKRDMQNALAAAGQSTNGQFSNKRGEAFFTGNWNQEASAQISREAAAAQAIEIGLQYFSALGVEVNPHPAHIDRPYDYDVYLDEQTSFYEHRFSDPAPFIERAKSQWTRRSKYNPAQSEYTRVHFSLTLDGMTLARNPSYPAGFIDEPDAWEGFQADAYVIVSDSGILVEASCSLLEIASKRPLENDPIYETFLSQYAEQTSHIAHGNNWQEALATALPNIGVVAQQPDMPYQNKEMSSPITAFCFKTVITAIRPILHTISRDEWAPFWQIEINQEYIDGCRL